MLYHALKLYFLAPELRYTAGGFIWPVDKTAEVSMFKGDSHRRSSRNPSRHRSKSRHSRHGHRDRHDRSHGHYHRGGPIYDSDSEDYSSFSDEERDGSLASQVLASGAVPLAQTGIQLLTTHGQGAITRQKIPFLDKEEGAVLDVLYVNICMVLFVA